MAPKPFTCMRVLALEPFYGGSHRAFLEGWKKRSRHEFTILSLPGYKWKWRMRHAAVTFASELCARIQQGDQWDVIWASDMLNMAEFLGLAPREIQQLPRVAYFHENQLTYPVRVESERDLHFAFSNLTTAICSDAVWFNSEFHREDLLSAMHNYLRRMPDFAPMAELDRVKEKSSVQYPGVELESSRRGGRGSPLRILWNARWEHDKNPDLFFNAVSDLRQKNVDFRLIVLGEAFRHRPAVFDQAKTEFANVIDHWGYAETRTEYVELLEQADVVVSTALHEFFGIGVVESIYAGAVPLLPNRLAYPEVLRELGLPHSVCLYDGTKEDLLARLVRHAKKDQEPPQNRDWPALSRAFTWEVRAREMDSAIEQVAAR